MSNRRNYIKFTNTWKLNMYNRMKDINHMIISLNADKNDKIHHPFIVNTLKKAGIGRMYFNTKKSQIIGPLLTLYLKVKK